MLGYSSNTILLNYLIITLVNINSITIIAITIVTSDDRSTIIYIFVSTTTLVSA